MGGKENAEKHQSPFRQKQTKRHRKANGATNGQDTYNQQSNSRKRSAEKI